MRSLSLDPDQLSRSLFLALVSSSREQVLSVAASGFPVRLPPVSLSDREGFRKSHSQCFSTSQKLKGRASFGPCFFPVVFSAPLPLFSPSLPGRSFLIQYVPWASLFLWPPWLLNSGGTTEKTSERMWLCVHRGGRTNRTLCVLLHTTKVCVCVCLTRFKTIHKIDDTLYGL